jgi:hypothetical protein
VRLFARTRAREVSARLDVERKAREQRETGELVELLVGGLDQEGERFPLRELLRQVARALELNVELVGLPKILRDKNTGIALVAGARAPRERAAVHNP